MKNFFFFDALGSSLAGGYTVYIVTGQWEAGIYSSIAIIFFLAAILQALIVQTNTQSHRNP